MHPRFLGLLFSLCFLTAAGKRLYQWRREGGGKRGITIMHKQDFMDLRHNPVDLQTRLNSGTFADFLFINIFLIFSFFIFSFTALVVSNCPDYIRSRIQHLHILYQQLILPVRSFLNMMYFSILISGRNTLIPYLIFS